MKAVIFEKLNSMKVVEVSTPNLEDPRDSLVKVTATSICGSDLHILKGNVLVEENTILGHEAVGVVEKVGSNVKRIKSGDRVLISCTVQCGECSSCKKGLLAHCEHGGIFGCGKRRGGFPGAQAEYIRIPYSDTVLESIPKELTDEQVIFAGDILSTGYMASENGDIQPGDIVVVFGAGPVGLCALATARLFGPSVIVSVDLTNYRLEAARRLGADIIINPRETNVIEEIKKITDGRGADVTIEAVGDPEALKDCIESVRAGGNISIVGIFPPVDVPLSIKEMVIKNLQIKMGIVNNVNMDKLIRLISSGVLDMTSLITHRMPLGEAENAYRIFGMRSENVLKIILYP